MGLFDFMIVEIAMDLGTANTLIIYDGKIVVDSLWWPGILETGKLLL
jgi:actin-like ATPase involved in cell morphogenesis